jgi:hypothetical protein
MKSIVRLMLALALLFAAPAFAADLTITAANVKATSQTATIARVKFGETVTQGQAVRLDDATGEYMKADADAGSDAAAAVVGITLTPGGDNEYGYIISQGTLNIGATLTVGEIYVLSGTAGGVCPEADLATGDRVTVIGVATSTSIISVKPFASTAVVP